MFGIQVRFIILKKNQGSGALWKYMKIRCDMQDRTTARHHDHNDGVPYGFKVRPTQLPGTHLSGEELSGKSWTLGRPNKDQGWFKTPKRSKMHVTTKTRKTIKPKHNSWIYRERNVQLGYHSWYLRIYYACMVSLPVFLFTHLSGSSPFHCIGNLPHQSSKSEKNTDKDCTKTTPPIRPGLAYHTHQAKNLWPSL